MTRLRDGLLATALGASFLFCLLAVGAGLVPPWWRLAFAPSRARTGLPAGEEPD